MPHAATGQLQMNSSWKDNQDYGAVKEGHERNSNKYLKDTLGPCIAACIGRMLIPLDLLVINNKNSSTLKENYILPNGRLSS